eukprot:2196146-Pyramimonas_sp.AAC.1
MSQRSSPGYLLSMFEHASCRGTLESRDGPVTDRAVTSKSRKTSPYGPSPHGLGTLEVPIARDILGEGLKSPNRA